MISDGPERRLYPRFGLTTQYNVLISMLESEEQKPYRVVNFSRGGMLLELAYSMSKVLDQLTLFSPGQTIAIRFGRQESGEVEGQVIRAGETELVVHFADPDSKLLDRMHGQVMKHVSRAEARRQVGVVLDQVDDD